MSARTGYLAWVKCPDADVRLVYVKEAVGYVAEVQCEVAICCLVHTYPEMATTMDLVCSPPSPKFPIVVQNDLFAAIDQAHLKEMEQLDTAHPSAYWGVLPLVRRTELWAFKAA